MKIYLRLLSIICLSCLLSCNKEQLQEQPIEQDYFKVTEFTVMNKMFNKDAQGSTPCFTLDLIAGQHMTVGSVAVSKTETDLILTYTTIADWTIGATHVSIGDCNEEWAPTTGSGNPKIGKFGHTEPHSAEINKVVYEISLDVLPLETDLFCFAAHAEVLGPEGEETAWAGDDGNNDDGGDDESPAYRNTNFQSLYTVKEFEGRSWATYIEALQSACD